MFQKGMVTPELTEAMMKAFAPNIMDAAKNAAMAASPAPIPTNITEALQGQQPTDAAPAEGETAPAAEETAPAPESTEPPVPLAEPSQP